MDDMEAEQMLLDSIEDVTEAEMMKEFDVWGKGHGDEASANVYNDGDVQFTDQFSNRSLSNGSTAETATTAATTATALTPSQQDDEFKKRPLTYRPPIKLYLSCDPDSFSEYQVIVRNNIEMFEAVECDVEAGAQGRNKPIVLGQVGIRCMHCNFLPPGERTRGATYFPSKLSGLYQAAQNLAVSHLMEEHCIHVPAKTRAELIRLREQKSQAGGGKREWAERAHALGVYEDSNGLRFADRVDAFASQHVHVHHSGV